MLRLEIPSPKDKLFAYITQKSTEYESPQRWTPHQCLTACKLLRNVTDTIPANTTDEQWKGLSEPAQSVLHSIDEVTPQNKLTAERVERFERTDAAFEDGEIPDTIAAPPRAESPRNNRDRADFRRGRRKNKRMICPYRNISMAQLAIVGRFESTNANDLLFVRHQIPWNYYLSLVVSVKH